MNREIKFRIWDGKEIRYPDYFNFDSLQVFDSYREVENCTPIKNAVIMQYTGLKDKNGVEIYEGDIIKATIISEFPKYFDDAVKIQIVCFEDCAWFCKTIKTETLDKDDNDLRRYIYLYNKSIIEIIGNLHQNPELLNQ